MNCFLGQPNNYRWKVLYWRILANSCKKNDKIRKMVFFSAYLNSGGPFKWYLLSFLEQQHIPGSTWYISASDMELVISFKEFWFLQERNGVNRSLPGYHFYWIQQYHIISRTDRMSRATQEMTSSSWYFQFSFQVTKCLLTSLILYFFSLTLKKLGPGWCYNFLF